jgi:ribosomal protein S18 acetylase RimI-like enzyme
MRSKIFLQPEDVRSIRGESASLLAMKAIVIRPYRDADFETVTSIWFESWRSTGVPSPVTHADLRARLPGDLKAWTVHVATSGNEIAGFIALEAGHLHQLFIAPAHQNRGIGKMLLDFAKERMPQGFRLMTALESAAGRFYEREGLHRGDITTHHFGHKIVRYDWKPI